MTLQNRRPDLYRSPAWLQARSLLPPRTTEPANGVPEDGWKVRNCLVAPAAPPQRASPVVQHGLPAIELLLPQDGRYILGDVDRDPGTVPGIVRPIVQVHSALSRPRHSER